ncbi:MAG: response regulator transcription factor, partial [Chloroflexota bacterium]|nr:response regulator transcription factor [Chloroflexota bacterium]
MTTILVVDDEVSIVELARLYLERDGFRVLGAADGKAALEAFAMHKPDLLVVDVMMPRLDGFGLVQEVRKDSLVPVIMLTARSEDVDKIVGLEMGADDYVTKPFNPRELVARVKAVLRRFESGGQPTRRIECGNLVVDLDKRDVTVGDQRVRLRTREFELLAALAQNAEIVLSRDQLLENVWGYEYAGETRTVDVHVNHLRDKLSDCDAEIETVWGV